MARITRVSSPQAGVRLHVSAGDVFGRLTVICETDPKQLYKRNGTKDGMRRVFDCKCACGKLLPVQLNHLRNGNTKSCGCHKSEVTASRNRENSSHGMSYSPEFGAWQAMKGRCMERSVVAHPTYKGVKVCREWQDDFVAFYEHIGPRPSPLYSVDRIDVFGDYMPGNVRWSTAKEQARNRRYNVRVEIQGESVLLCELAEQHGLLHCTMLNRFNRGVTGTDLIAPVNRNKKAA